MGALSFVLFFHWFFLCITDISFNYSNWDDVAKIPTPHLYYILSLVLPVRLVGQKAIEEGKKLSEQAFLKQLDEQAQKSMRFVGSFFEGYSIPPCMRKTNPLRAEQNSDLDIIALFDAKIGQVKDINNQEYSAILETENVHPGYARLWVHKLPERKKKFSIFQEAIVYSKENDRHYLSSSIFSEKALSVVTQDTNNECTIHGPALMFAQDEPIIRSGTILESFDGIDIVPGFGITEWPSKLADELRHRASRSEWLDSAFVESIIEEGCHIVSIPSKKSPFPDIEWRISFSLTEVRIARELVTDKQRQCYLFLKILRKQTMKQLETLSSYHCKTVFLYCCERLPVSVWEDYPGTCLIYMLDCLIECVSKRSLPSYFVPENNMINHLSEEELAHIMTVLKSARMNVVEPLLSFTDTRVFGFLPVQVPLRELVQYVVKDMEDFRTHRSLELSKLAVLVPTSIGVAQILMHETKYEGIGEEAKQTKFQEAVSYLLDTFEIVNESTSEPVISLRYILDKAALSLDSATMAIELYENALSFSDKYPVILGIRGNLACMYHSAACAYSRETEEYKIRLSKALQLFTVFVEEENNRGSVIDYAVVLFYESKFSKCKDILETFINEEKEYIKSPRFSCRFGVSELGRLDSHLQEDIKRHGTIVACALAFAYYFLLQCLIQLDFSEQLIEIKLQDFEALCKIAAQPRTYALLGYVLLDRHLWCRARSVFSSAVAIEKRYSLAVELISTCEEKEQKVKEGEFLSEGNFESALENILVNEENNVKEHASISESNDIKSEKSSLVSKEEEDTVMEDVSVSKGNENETVESTLVREEKEKSVKENAPIDQDHCENKAEKSSLVSNEKEGTVKEDVSVSKGNEKKTVESMLVSEEKGESVKESAPIDKGKESNQI